MRLWGKLLILAALSALGTFDAACSKDSGGSSPAPTPAPSPAPIPSPTPTPLPTPTPNPAPFPAPTPTPSPAPDPSTIQQVLTDLNAQRAQNGLAAVVLNDKLTCAANSHAQDIGVAHSCSHYGTKDNSTPFDRMKTCGYNYEAAGEIIACGQTTPQAAVDAWMSDEPHKAIVLGTYKEVGIAVVNNYWVVDWGTRCISCE